MNSPSRPATPQDIDLAYRLLLGRPADADGLAHYGQRITEGLTLNALTSELLNSSEFRDKAGLPNAADVDAVTVEPTTATDLITPRQVLAQYTLDELNETADEYYRRLPDVTPFMAKPFAFLNETPEILENLGLLLAELELGKTMTVLDFGGGTGWLSRILSQLNCAPICCDVSAAALDIARQLFRDHPPVGHFAAPTFLRFDGHRIDLPDASVDRIICFDAFHHVPNPEDVIREFGRVLKPGGIAGFSEPGPAHSRSPQSQYEMTHHRVLENDIHLDELAEFARASGFTDVTVRTLADGTISVDQYLALINGPLTHESRQLALDAVRGPMTSRSIFFFSKGSPIPDSRGHVGLAHTLTVNPTNAFVPDGGSQPSNGCICLHPRPSHENGHKNGENVGR